MPAFEALPEVVRLTSLTAEDIERIGGKACGLLRLIKAGFPVPDAWVIAAQPVPEGETKLPEGLLQQANALWEAIQFEHPGARVAVRSSATAEDLVEKSFAGVYLTVLNVNGLSAFIEAILQCRAALHSEQGQAYRRANRIGGRPSLALVVQRMVDADVAGVLMTSNPLRPLAGELVIDAAYGLGESVVAGRLQPDHLVVRKSDGEIIEEYIGAKEFSLVYRKGRMHEVHVPEDRRKQRALSGTQLALLRRLAIDVEARIGVRQDCEWAFEGETLFVLQQRPITGLPPENPRQVFSRKFGDEYIADYALPLSYSILMPWISETFLGDFSRRFGFADRLEHPPTVRHEGYAYVSGEFVAQMLSALPKSLRRTDAVDWFPEQWNERIKREPFRPLQLGRMVLTALRDPMSSIRKNPEDLAAHCRRVAALIAPKLRQDYGALTEGEWENQFAEALRFGDAHFSVIRWGMGFHNPLLHSLLKDFLAQWLNDDGSLYQVLISGLPETKTAEVNRAIWRLAQAARNDDLVTALLEEAITYPMAREASADSGFWQLFDQFMAAYGHRGATRDIALPRWAEVPDVVLGFLRAQLTVGAAAPGDERQSEKQRLAAEESLAARLGLGVAAGVKRKVLQEVLALAQTYTVYREDQRFYLDYILTHVRNLILEAGRRLATRKVTELPDDIFYLEKAEFLDVRRLGGAVGLREKIKERRAHFVKWHARLPATYLYDGVAVDELAKAQNRVVPEGALAGLAASMGTARARARVILSLGELGALQAGEILVTSNTDPGWTSVFPMLAGLVTATGGILSHGALLAREYGIPAVTGVDGAVLKIRTGDMLELNAREGWVRVIEPLEAV